MRFFVTAAPSMSAASSIDLGMYVFKSCESVTRPMHICIRPSDLHKQSTCETHLLFRPCRHLSSRLVLVLVLACSGIMSSSTSTRRVGSSTSSMLNVLCKIIYFFKTNSKAPRCDLGPPPTHINRSPSSHISPHAHIRRIPHTTTAPGVSRSGAHRCRLGGAETPARRRQYDAAGWL